MIFKPTNRYILIELIEYDKEENQSMIYLPEGYKKSEEPYICCLVKDVAADSKFFNSTKRGDKIVIEQRMLQKVDVEGKQFYLILENYVLGRIQS